MTIRFGVKRWPIKLYVIVYKKKAATKFFKKLHITLYTICIPKAFIHIYTFLASACTFHFLYASMELQTFIRSFYHYRRAEDNKPNICAPMEMDPTISIPILFCILFQLKENIRQFEISKNPILKKGFARTQDLKKIQQR